MLLFFISRYFILTLLLLLLTAFFHVVQPLKIGFLTDVLAPPLLSIALVYWYKSHGHSVDLHQRARLSAYLAMVSAFLQGFSVFLAFNEPTFKMTEALLSIVSVVIFHTLMIYFALGFAIERVKGKAERAVASS